MDRYCKKINQETLIHFITNAVSCCAYYIHAYSYFTLTVLVFTVPYSYSTSFHRRWIIIRRMF